jgi:hypothetical protein
MQMDNSIAGSSLQHSDPSSTSLAPTEPAPPLSVAVSQMSSHPMLTRAKAGIFKTRHPANLAFLGSSGLLSPLLASVEPKGFKSAAKNPSWLAAVARRKTPRGVPALAMAVFLSVIGIDFVWSRHQVFN